MLRSRTGTLQAPAPLHLPPPRPCDDAAWKTAGDERQTREIVTRRPARPTSARLPRSLPHEDLEALEADLGEQVVDHLLGRVAGHVPQPDLAGNVTRRQNDLCSTLSYLPAMCTVLASCLRTTHWVHKVHASGSRKRDGSLAVAPLLRLPVGPRGPHRSHGGAGPAGGGKAAALASGGVCPAEPGHDTNLPPAGADSNR